MIYSFARIGAAVAMRVEDFRPTGRRWSIRLREKGGLAHEVPAHHNLEAWCTTTSKQRESQTILGAGCSSGRGAHRSPDRTPAPGPQRARHDRRRARNAGLVVPGLCNHSLRATGITTYIAAGGALDTVQAIAGHASPRRTQLYDRTGDAIALDEIERIIL